MLQHALVLYNFLWPHNILLCGHTIHLSVDGYLGCFDFLAITVMLLGNIHVRAFFHGRLFSIHMEALFS